CSSTARWSVASRTSRSWRPRASSRADALRHLRGERSLIRGPEIERERRDAGGAFVVRLGIGAGDVVVAHLTGAAEPQILAAAWIRAVVDVFDVETRTEPRGTDWPRVAGPDGPAGDIDVEERRRR